MKQDDPRTLLKQKILANYEEFRSKWLQMEPADLIEQCEQMEGVTRMMRDIPSAVSDEDAQYLLRFKNPLEVVSDEWISRNGIDSLIVDDEMSHLLWSLRDKGAAEECYELEPDAKEIALQLIQTGMENTTTGNWIFSFEEINEKYGTNLPADQGLLNRISGQLYDRSDSVADFCISEEGVDLDFYYGQCPNYCGDDEDMEEGIQPQM